MTDEVLDDEAQELLRIATERWAQRMVKELSRPGQNRELLGRHVIELTPQLQRHALAVELLYSLAPEHADPDLWLDWIRGGRSPHVGLVTQQFEDGRENSGRKIADAEKHLSDTQRLAAAARRRVEQARNDLSAAELDLQRAEHAEKRARDIARGVTAWAYLNEVARVASGVFAMGPAWSLMRLVSGHLREDPEWEKGLSESDLASVDEYRKTRASHSKEMLQILHGISGDPSLEVDIFGKLYTLLKQYEEQANRSRGSSMKTMKSSVGNHATTDDAKAVVDGVQR